MTDPLQQLLPAPMSMIIAAILDRQGKLSALFNNALETADRDIG